MLRLLKHATAMLFLASSLITAEIKVRDYNPLRDPQRILSICGQNHKALDECKACGGTLMFMLYILGIHKDLDAWIKVLEKDETIVGFIAYNEFGVNPKLPEFIKNLFAELKLAELSYIALDKQHQGKGYGHMLFQAMLEDITSRGYSGILASVCDENGTAMKWHEKEGFKPIVESENIIDDYRAQAQITGHTPYLYRITNKIDEPHFLVLNSKIKKTLNPELENLKQEKLNSQVQCLVAERAAHEIMRRSKHSLYSERDLARMLQRYLVTNLNSDKVEQFATFLLNVNPLMITESLREDLSFLDNNILELQKAVMAEIKNRNMIKSFTCDGQDCYYALFR
jgi:ribosomal protein S18 acetylase RimI-like enzyme